MSTSQEHLWKIVGEAAGRSATSRFDVDSKLMLALSKVLIDHFTTSDEGLVSDSVLAARYWGGEMALSNDIDSCLQSVWNKIDRVERSREVNQSEVSKLRALMIVLQRRFCLPGEIDDAVEAFCTYVRGFVGDEVDVEGLIVAEFIKEI